MMAEQFIDRLQQQGLLDERVVNELRRRLAKIEGKTITPEAVAKFLVDKGHLTRFQATKLVSEITSVNEQAAALDAEAPDDKAGDPSGGRPATGDRELDDLLDIGDPTESVEPAKRPKRTDPTEAKPKEPRQKRPSDATVAPKRKKKRSRRHRETEKPAAPSPPPPTASLLEEEDLGAELESSGRTLTPPPKRSALGGLTDLFSASDAGRPTPTQRKLQPSSQWDSMVLLGGGALLGILIVVGGFLVMSLTRGAAEDLYAAADQAYKDAGYTLAVKLFNKYLDAYPNHEKASLARVRKETARLRQVYQNPEQGLKVAKEILPKIEKEEDFANAREELASMLPQIAKGFIEQAKLSNNADKQQELVELTKDAMRLVNNPIYIPPTAMKPQQSTIDSINADIVRVQREIDEEENLLQTIADIETAVSSGATLAAYDARRELLATYPGLVTNEQLLEAVLKISEKEREKVEVGKESVKSVTEELPPAGELRVVLAHRMGQPIATVQGYVAYVLAGGSVCAMDVATGEMLWRRFIGFESVTQPQPLSNRTAGADAIVVDRRTQEVLRLDAKNGAVVWRLALGEPFADPVVSDQAIYIAMQSGKLRLIDPETGNAERFVQLPQELAVGPGVFEKRDYIYQLGEHDNLYVLHRDTLECEEVYYVGHKKGTVGVPPVMALGFLFIAVNSAPEFSDVHVIGTGQQGAGLKMAQRSLRLDGQILAPPVVGRRRILFVTDRRAIELYDVDATGETATPVTSVLRRNATAEQPMISHALMGTGYVWIANTQFAKYQVQAATGKMPSEWVKDEQDVYVAPLQLVRDVIISVRRRQGAPGVTVASIRQGEKEPTWQTELAVPVRKILVKDQQVNIVSGRGRLFELNDSDWKKGSVNRAKTSALRNERLIMNLSEAIELDANRWAFSARSGYNQVVLLEPGGKNGDLRVLTLTVPLGDATVEPTPMGQGMLIPLQSNEVTLVDMISGAQRARPFQPTTEGGTRTVWQPPALVGGGQEFVIADNHRRLFRVGLKEKPARHLAELSRFDLPDDIAGPLASTGNVVYGVTRSGADDTLHSFLLPNLDAGEQWPLTGRVSWGPRRVQGAVLVATGEQLIAMDGQQKQKWAVELPHGPIIGTPAVDGATGLFSTESGSVWRVDLATGETKGATEVGEPLQTGPVTYGDKLLVAGKSGALFVISAPGQ